MNFTKRSKVNQFSVHQFRTNRKIIFDIYFESGKGILLRCYYLHRIETSMKNIFFADLRYALSKLNLRGSFRRWS